MCVNLTSQLCVASPATVARVSNPNPKLLFHCSQAGFYRPRHGHHHMKGGGDNWVRDNLRPWVATGPPAPGKDVPREPRDASHWRHAKDFTAIGSDRCANPRVVYPSHDVSRYTNDYGASPKWVHESTTVERGVPGPPDDSTAAKLAHQILLCADKLRKELRVVDAERTGMIPLSTLKKVLSSSAGVSYMPVEWAKMLAVPADPTSSGQVSYKTMIEGILKKGGYTGRDAYFREEGGKWCSDTAKDGDVDEAKQVFNLQAKMAKMKKGSKELHQATQKLAALEKKLEKKRADTMRRTRKAGSRPHTAPGKRTISGLPGERTEWPAVFTGPQTGPRTYTRVALPLRAEQGHGAVAAYPWATQGASTERKIEGPHVGIKIDRQFEKAEVYRKYVAPAFVATRAHFS